MAEQAIIRTQVIVVDSVGQNSYGDLTFADKDGADYKISAKRKQYFEKTITPGVSVQLNYAMSSFGKEYIYSATAVKEGVFPQAQPHSAPKPEPIKFQPRPDNSASIEAQVAVKEIGECWRAGKLTDDEIYVSMYLAWIRTKLGAILPPPVETHTEEIPPEKEEVEVTPKPAVRPPPARKSTSGSTKIVPLQIEDIKTGADLFNFALANKWGINDIKDCIGVDKPNDVTDVPKAIKKMFGE